MNCAYRIAKSRSFNGLLVLIVQYHSCFECLTILQLRKCCDRVTEQLEVEYDFFLVWTVVDHRLLLPIYNAHVTHLEFCFTIIWKLVHSPIYSKNFHEQNILLQCFVGGFHSSLSGSFILRWNDCRIYITHRGSWGGGVAAVGRECKGQN
jgi:hypothetical protein